MTNEMRGESLMTSSKDVMIPLEGTNRRTGKLRRLAQAAELKKIAKTIEQQVQTGKITLNNRWIKTTRIVCTGMAEGHIQESSSKSKRTHSRGRAAPAHQSTRHSK